MVENGGDTAERELLKTIEGQASTLSKNRPSIGKSLLSLKSRLNFYIDKIRKKLSEGEEGYIFSLVNRGLICVSILLAIMVTIRVFRGIRRLGELPVYNVSTSYAVNVDKNIIPVKNYQVYADAILRRNFFLPFKEKKEVVKKTMTVSNIEEKVKKIRLVGISWISDTEKFVMIEDKETNVTYFLKEGDKILDMKIKKIFEDKVILEEGGEEYTLR